MITLHYAELEMTEDINQIDFANLRSIDEWIDNTLWDKHGVVFVVAVDEEVYVTSSPLSVAGFINYFINGALEEVFIQEYSSFEEAYKIALAMQEENPLCYE